MTDGAFAIIVTLVLLLTMLGEALLSRAHERFLRAQGAFEPPDDVYRAMLWAYPGCFVAMGIEGAIGGPPARAVVLLGAAVVVIAKGLKYWAMATLGTRWTFRVLVPPHNELVRSGPYIVVRHPNYVAVVGELTGMGFLVGAPWTCVASVVGFGALLLRRIKVEERMLGG